MSSVREVVIREEPIRLGQFLKLAGLADDGSHARALIEAGEVTVNGEAEHRRGRQLTGGDVIAIGGERIQVANVPD